jgi:hypothetical protein
LKVDLLGWEEVCKMGPLPRFTGCNPVEHSLTAQAFNAPGPFYLSASQWPPFSSDCSEKHEAKDIPAADVSARPVYF